MQWGSENQPLQSSIFEDLTLPIPTIQNLDLYVKHDVFFNFQMARLSG